jgi:hypothetical protein
MGIWYILWTFGTFYGHLVHFMDIWYILWTFGTFYGHLVHFMVIWYIFPPVLVSRTKKNLATLIHECRCLCPAQHNFSPDVEKRRVHVIQAGRQDSENFRHLDEFYNIGHFVRNLSFLFSRNWARSEFDQSWVGLHFGRFLALWAIFFTIASGHPDFYIPFLARCLGVAK